jgi:asparagine synthase (glutamine-hydrolysing)
MAAGLEVRVPFLDHDLVEAMAALPGPVRMPWGRKKWLLKRALQGIVPDEVLRAPKTGFSVPFGYWLRTSLRPFFFDHLATFECARPGLVDARVLHAWYDETAAGRLDHSTKLWKLLNFLVWCNTGRVSVPV